MKLRTQILTLGMLAFMGGIHAQSIKVSPELKDLIVTAINKDHKVTEKVIEKQIVTEKKIAVRAAYLPKLEMGGKFAYANTSVNSDFGDITGFESFQKIKELMGNPAFPSLFPQLSGLTNELSSLQALMAQQGIEIPSVSNGFDGNFSGKYFGLDASAKILLFSSGQVPNTARALNCNLQAQDALSDKYTAEVISEVIKYYDQLALLRQSGNVLDKSMLRLGEEKRLAFSALNNGMATSFDTLKITVAEASLAAKLADYEGKKEILSEKLSQLTGKPASYFYSIDAQLDVLIYDGIGGNITGRPELRALDAMVNAQKYLLKAEKSYNMPKVQAMASVRYDNIFDASADLNAPLDMGIKINSIGFGPTVLAGLGFKMDLFDRSGGYSKVRQTRLEILKTENAREEARELLALNLAGTNTNYQSAITQVAFKAKQLKAAQMSLDLAQKSYKQGVISISDRLLAETDLQNAELEYLQAVFAQRQATIECYKATGSLVLTNIK